MGNGVLTLSIVAFMLTRNKIDFPIEASVSWGTGSRSVGDAQKLTESQLLRSLARKVCTKTAACGAFSWNPGAHRC